MASASQSHPVFPSRQHISHPKLPDRNIGASSTNFGGGGGPSNTHFNRERQERERAAATSAAQQQQQKGPSFNDLSDEQKEEINEAVRIVRNVLCKDSFTGDFCLFAA